MVVLLVFSPRASSDSIAREFSDYDHVLTNNSDLRTIDSRFQHAEISYPTITIDSKVRGEENAAQGKKVELNAMELRPPLMDVSGKTKYPVLFQVWVHSLNAGGSMGKADHGQSTATEGRIRKWSRQSSSAIGSTTSALLSVTSSSGSIREALASEDDDTEF